MKKFLLTLVTSLILMFGGIMLAACGEEEEKTIAKVEIGSTPVKTEYVVDEAFDISGGSFKVTYEDGSSATVEMTPEMCGEADTSTCGEKQVTVTYAEGFAVQVKYTVIFSVNSNEFIKLSASLPMLNTVTLGDVDKIIAAETAWNALTDAEREYLDDAKPQAHSKVKELQRRLLPEYKEAADARVNEYYGYLNAGNYTDESFATINGYVQAFLNGEFETLAEVMAAEAKVYADIEAVEKKTDGEIDLEEYRASTLNALLAGLKGTLYRLEGGSVVSELKNYAEEDALKARVDELLAPITGASDIKGIDDGYKAAVDALRTIYIEAYLQDAQSSLDALVSEGRKLAEEQLDKWAQSTVSIRGLVEDIPLDYATDSRWWIPMPYRLSVLCGVVPAKLASAQTVEQINAYYETFAYEILRATLQRNLELVYAIERNLNASYDTNDVFYWHNIADCWGASAAAAFTYNGIVDEYIGEMYGTSDANAYRFAGRLYTNGGPETVAGLVTAYRETLNNIFVTITGVQITTQPKTAYEAGEVFTVAGGVITVSYSNGTSTTINMTNSMYDAEDVDMTPNGEYSVVLTFTVSGEQKSVTVNYTVAQKYVTNIRITTMPTVTTFGAGEEFTVAGGVITVTFNDNTTTTVTMTDEMYDEDDVDLETAGRKELTLTFTVLDAEQTATLEYTVVAEDAKRVTSVEIQTQPTKTEYALGEAFTVAGGKILVTYSDDTDETIDMTDDMYEASDANTTSAGEKTVTLTFTVNEETKTLELTYEVLEDEAYDALVAKVGALPTAGEATEEDVSAMQECIELYEGLADGAKSVFEEVNATLYAKYNAVQKALVPVYASAQTASYADSYKYLNRFNYEETEIATLDEAYTALTAALEAAETFAAADEALAAYAEVSEGLTEKATTVQEFAANSALTAAALAEKVAVGKLYQVSATGYAKLSISLREVSFAEEEAIAEAIEAFRTALEGAATLDAAKEIYEAQIRTLFDAAVLDAYLAAANANLKALVNDLRDTVKEIWEKDGFEYGETYGNAGGWLDMNYMANYGSYDWRTPEPYRVSTLYEKLTVASAGTMAELFANYDAAYVEMLTAVMYRNLYSVYWYNYFTDQSLNEWQIISGYCGDGGVDYDGLLEEYQGHIDGEFRLWYWGYHPTEKVSTVNELVEKYNWDMNTYLLADQK